MKRRGRVLLSVGRLVGREGLSCNIGHNVPYSKQGESYCIPSAKKLLCIKRIHIGWGAHAYVFFSFFPSPGSKL